MLAIGSVQMMFSSAVKEQKVQFDLPAFIQNVVLQSITDSGLLYYYPLHYLPSPLYCRTGFDSDGLTGHENSGEKLSLSLKFAIEIISIIPFIGVVFPLMGSLSLDRYHFYFLIILKETLTSLPLSNQVLQ